MTRPSSPPTHANLTPADLNEKRREVLESLSHGTRLTQEVLTENQRLITAVEELKAENAQLRSVLDADDAARTLVTKIAELERERERLLTHTAAAEERATTIGDGIADLERSLNDLANLYVASNSLHSTLSMRGTFRRLNEILEQLVGVQAHVLYLGSESPPLRPVSSRGLRPEERELLDVCPPQVLAVAASGRASIDEQQDASAGTIAAPAAAFPLILEGNVVGVLSIVRALSHKPRLTDTDFQIFRFLGQHAAIALVGAGLFALNGQRVPLPETFESVENQGT